MMKPISAEDICGYMKKQNMWMGIIVLLITVAIATANSIGITKFNIMDTNPTTYIIVVILMIFLFILFSVKEDLHLEYKKTNIVYGFLLITFFFVITSILRGSLSFLFASYRVDALLFPLILLSLIITLFGRKGVVKLKWLIVYSAFASPILMLPFIGLNNFFVEMNASFVYSVLSLIGLPIIKNGLMISAPSTSTITIAETCADIGAFIGLIMFLLPIFYLFEGKLKKKILWISSAVLLLLLLNFLRMLFISLEWIYNGIGSAVSIFHIFAGQIMFDAVIVIMIIFAYKYGLKFPSKHTLISKRKRRKDKRTDVKIYYSIAAALVIAIISFVITYPYHNMINISNNNFYNKNINSTNQTMSLIYLASIKSKNSYIYSLGSINNKSIGFSVVNKTTNNMEYIVTAANGYPDPSSLITNKTNARGYITILQNGLVIHSYIILSNSYEFYTNTFSFPALINGKYASIKMEFFAPANSTFIGCNPNSGWIDNTESILANIFNGNLRRHNIFCTAYNSAESVT